MSFQQLAERFKSDDYMISRNEGRALLEAAEVMREALDKKHNHWHVSGDPSIKNCEACVALAKADEICKPPEGLKKESK